MRNQSGNAHLHKLDHTRKAGLHPVAVFRPCGSLRNHKVKGPAMKLMVNGQERELSSPVTVAMLLTELGVVGKRVAVEVNQEIVPRSQHGQFKLNDRDRIEVVFAIGGG